MSDELRRRVAARASHCCEYCRSQECFSPEAFSVEHTEPLSSGGATEPANLALACQGCNSHKATMTCAADPLTGIVVGLYHPRRERWSEHFSWSPDWTQVVGLTPTGRATVVALKLNTERLVNLRRVLRAAGEHPPLERHVE